MDSLDLAILREGFLDRTLRLGGADPRRSAAEIADRLGLATSTVSQRIRNWTRDGVVDGYIVFPNPQLLGRTIFGQVLEIGSESARAAVLERIRTVPGVAHVWEPETGPFAWIGYLARDPGPARRGARALAEIPEVRVSLIEHVFPMPTCDLELSPLDWRLVEEVRRDPTRSATALAASLHLGFRTVARRLDRLITGHGLLFLPRFDLSRGAGSVAEIEVWLSVDADIAELWERIERAYPAVLPHAPWGRADRVWDLVPGDDRFGPNISYFVSLSSAADVVRAGREVERWPGVRRAGTFFPIRVWDLPAPYDAELARRAPAARGPGRGRDRDSPPT